MKIKILIALLLGSSLSISLFAQNHIRYIQGDTLALNLIDTRGAVQWQRSSDSLNWVLIPGQDSALLQVSSSITSQWVRPIINEQGCPEFRGANFYITANDTNSITFEQNSINIADLPWDFVSYSSNGIVLFENGSADISIEPGDLLLGVNGQATTLLILAIVYQNGQISIYTSDYTSTGEVSWGAEIIASVSGIVLNENSQPVIGAEITIGDSICYTNSQGVFVFPAVNVFEEFGFVKIIKKGYFNGYRSFIPKQAGNNIFVTLLEKDVDATFNASTGGTVIIDGISINFAPSSITRFGQPYNGLVKVALQKLDQNTEGFNQRFPGGILGVQNGLAKGMNSFGAIMVALTDSTQYDLNIATGQTATVVYPIPSGMLANAPATIGIWSYNEDEGYYQEEAIASRVGNTYYSQIPHFSIWIWSIAYDIIQINGSLQDQSGNPICGATVGFAENGLFGGLDYTNSVGEFGAFIPADIPVQVSVYLTCNATEQVNVFNGPIGPFSSDIDLPPMSITLASQMNAITGSVTNCSNMPLTEGYLEINGLIYFTNNGAFSTHVCGNQLEIRPVRSTPVVEFGDVLSVTLSQYSTDLGEIQLCNGDTVQTSTVTDIDGNVYKTVLIGAQWWMAESLRTTRFANGTLIPNITNDNVWASLTTPAWSVYENNMALDSINGKLYNYYTVSASGNLCPANWHVPSYGDFEILWNNLGGYPIAGGKMKGTATFPASPSWAPPNLGASNVSGFSAYGVGMRLYEGSFSGVYYDGMFWTSDNTSNTTGGSIYLSSTFKYISTWDYNKSAGKNIRCVMN